MPRWDGTDLTGGTVLKGKIYCVGYSGIEIGNIGVDQRSLATTVKNGLEAGKAEGDTLDYHFHDIITVGRNYTTGGSEHGFLIQGGRGVRIRNLKAYYFGHNIALRASRIQGADLYSEDADLNGVIVKSGNTGTANNCEDVNLSNLNLVSTGAFKANVCVDAVHASYVTKRVNISNVNSYGSANPSGYITSSGGGTVDGVNMVAVHSLNCTSGNGSFMLTGGKNINFIGCQSVNATGHAFRNNAATGVNLIGCIAVNPAAQQFGTFDFAQVNGVAQTLHAGSDMPATSAHILMGADSRNGFMRLYRYSGTAGQWWATEIGNNYQNFRIRMATAGAAIGLETYDKTIIESTNAGKWGIGGVTPSASLTLPAGAAAAGSAPLKLTAGTNLTTVENGALEYDGTNLYFTTGGVRKTVSMI
jgi:hypothetical protein